MRKASSPSAKDNSVRCEMCNKTFARKCELRYADDDAVPWSYSKFANYPRRKHMKRHDKPYGCTYAKCKKRFGSKNDWKRHESSQHAQSEVWRCDTTMDGSDELCRKSCHRKETFKQHLQRDHSMKDTKLIEENWRAVVWATAAIHDSGAVSVKRRSR